MSEANCAGCNDSGENASIQDLTPPPHAEGVELIKVRDLLGHSSIRMTERTRTLRSFGCMRLWAFWMASMGSAI